MNILICIDLMNSEKINFGNFEPLSDNVKKDGNKNKFILEATLTYIKSTDRFSRSIFN